jgi:hypothetical protein
MYDTGIDEDRECQDSKEHPYGYFSFTLTSFPFDTVGSYKLRFALRDGTREVLTKDFEVKVVPLVVGGMTMTIDNSLIIPVTNPLPGFAIQLTDAAKNPISYCGDVMLKITAPGLEVDCFSDGAVHPDPKFGLGSEEEGQIEADGDIVQWIMRLARPDQLLFPADSVLPDRKVTFTAIVSAPVAGSSKPKPIGRETFDLILCPG